MHVSVIVSSPACRSLLVPSVVYLQELVWVERQQCCGALQRPRYKRSPHTLLKVRFQQLLVRLAPLALWLGVPRLRVCAVCAQLNFSLYLPPIDSGDNTGVKGFGVQKVGRVPFPVKEEEGRHGSIRHTEEGAQVARACFRGVERELHVFRRRMHAIILDTRRDRRKLALM